MDAIKTRPTLSQLRREYKTAIPADYKGAGSKDSPEPLREPTSRGKQAGSRLYDPPCNTILMFYYEPTLNADAFHPKRICELVFVEGIETEVRHRYCPYQSLDNEGRLTANSMIGYPIHVLTLRDVPDDNHVPSDSSMTRPSLMN